MQWQKCGETPSREEFLEIQGLEHKYPAYSAYLGTKILYPQFDTSTILEALGAERCENIKYDITKFIES